MTSRCSPLTGRYESPNRRPPPLVPKTIYTMVVGWFTWALSVTAAMSDEWFMGSDIKAGESDILNYCSDKVGHSGTSFQVKWCALCKWLLYVTLYGVLSGVVGRLF